MADILRHLIADLQAWMQTIQSRHGVNPWIFLVMTTACAPFFYYSGYRLARAATRREAGGINLWGAVFLAATALPYVYVMALGRNLPWYIYIVLAALVGQGVWSVSRRLRQPKG